MRRHATRVVAAAVLAVVALLGTPTVVGADVPPPAEVTSNFETYFGAELVRDCGYSQPVPGQASQACWLDCDTLVYDLWGDWVDSIAGSTAARGPFTAGLVPQALSELPTPPAALPTMPNNHGPAQFLPTPTGLERGNGTDCTGTAYPASWITGLTTIPGTARYLVTYHDVCVESATTYTISRVGMVEYAPATNTLSNDRKVFTVPAGTNLPVQLQRLGSPIFGGDGNLYLFGSVCTAFGQYSECSSGSVYEARVPAASRGTASAYRFRNGSVWEADHTRATSVVSGARPVEVNVHDFSRVGHGIVILEGTSAGGTLRLWTAGSPTGTFSPIGGERRLDGCAVPAGVWDFCRAFIGHPELSSSSRLAFTYYAYEGRHVRMNALDW